MKHWGKEESLSRKEMKKLQGERLAKVCARVYASVPFYKKAFDKAKIKPAQIESIDDIVRLPFTTKLDLRDNYPFGMFAVPMKDIIRIHASSGTTGQPTAVGYTRYDIEIWAEAMARTMTARRPKRRCSTRPISATALRSASGPPISSRKNRTARARRSTSPGILRRESRFSSVSAM